MANREDFIGINRHRICTDGVGVTSLVAFGGCPLRCRYCLNAEALADRRRRLSFSPDELFEKLKADDLYFVATGGGVTFGGGEPLLYPDFIISFRQRCTHRWKINIETSLNVPNSSVASLAYDIDRWIVDVKDMNPQIYRAYTEKDNTAVYENLRTLVRAGSKIIARVPLIPGYNTAEDVAKSIGILNDMGITEIDKFEYFIKSRK